MLPRIADHAYALSSSASGATSPLAKLATPARELFLRPIGVGVGVGVGVRLGVRLGLVVRARAAPAADLAHDPVARAHDL